ncbi:MAG: pseudouridine synthase [Thermodesulfobacteriota bacterium]|nr:pseudouridine synthase [Thermodesulfobacteriota bacterium]
MRINRYIAQRTDISRRASDRVIEQGRVCINGRRASVGQLVDPESDQVEMDGKCLIERPLVYLAMYKPVGMITSMHDPQKRPCIKDIIPPEFSGVYPVGRLDYDASGLILLTNEGDLAHSIHHPSFNVPKVYLVGLEPAARQGQLSAMANGIVLDGVRTRPAQVEYLRKIPKGSLVRIALRQGLKNQIKRMAAATGLRVKSIHRISVGPVMLGDMQPSEVRRLTDLEKKMLFEIIHSYKPA